MKGWQGLLKVSAHFRFEPHDIAAQLDARGHYAVELDEEFPLLIKFFHYSSRRHTPGGGPGTNGWNCSSRSMGRRGSAWVSKKSICERGIFSWWTT